MTRGPLAFCVILSEAKDLARASVRMRTSLLVARLSPLRKQYKGRERVAPSADPHSSLLASVALGMPVRM